MDTSVGIVLLCALYISVADAKYSFYDYIDGRDYISGHYRGVLGLLTSRDCECTPNGIFLPDYDGYVARDRETSLKRDQMVQVECTTLNINRTEFKSVLDEHVTYHNYSGYPVAYRLNCHRKWSRPIPCINILYFLELKYLSLNGCSLRFPYNTNWRYLEVLEVMDDAGLVVDVYENKTIDGIVEYMSLRLFRWCSGNSNRLLTEEEIFPIMPVLRTFTAEGCRLMWFPFGGGFIRTLKRSSHLELINLSQNNIQFLEVFNTSQLNSPHLTLDFSHNEIHTVTSDQLELLAGRESIYVNLSHNYITDIDIPESYAFTKPNVTIDLSYNKITTISQADFEHLVNATSTFVNLQNNQLDCDCRISFLWEISLFGNYAYILREKCASPKQFAGKYLKRLTVSDVCPIHDGSNPIYLKLETSISLVATVVVTTVIISILMFKYRTEMRVVIYTKFGVVLPFGSRDFDENKRYDAFVAYSHEDLDWVLRTLFPILTEDGNDFKICLNHKDFIPGKPIAENIADAIEWSRYTVLVLSRNFLRSEWCKYEFRSAFDQSIRERKQQMIFILLEEVANDKMDSDLRKCLRLYTYIKADDVLLRERMTYALSDKRRGRRDPAQRGARRRMLGVQPRVEEGQAAAANVIQEDDTLL